MNENKYRYLPHPSPGHERKVFRPDSQRIVDAVQELNRLSQLIAELEAKLKRQNEIYHRQRDMMAEYEAKLEAMDFLLVQAGVLKTGDEDE